METVYYNGVIVTMEHDKKNIQAVLTENGRIKKTGSLEEISAVATESCCWKNLQGHTLMPGFIDSHSHFISYADSLLQADLSGAESIREITERISAFIAENDILPGEWVRARGYDHNFLQGRRHPILAELNAMSPDNPLVIQHQSGHVGLLNTYALNQLGITEETTQMYPGMIGWGEGGATGYLEETAFVEAIKNIPMPSEEKFFKAIKKAQDVYLSHGITTMQEGMVVQLMLPFLRYAVKNGFLKADYVGYLDYQAREELSYIYSEYMNGYKEHFRIGGYKIFLDGSPQAKTAWVGEPYEGTEKCGYPIMSNEDVAEACMQAEKEHIQILAHCNGDRACDQFIDAWHLTFKDMKAEKREESDIRPVIVHAQMITKEQLKKAKECCMIPSFFVSHVYYWGDVHLENLGCKRAKEISPLKEAVNLNMPFSIHTDAPVIEPNQLEAVWCAVNRITKKGVPLGIKQCIDVYDALKAVTIDAAYQYHEENRKGSIAPGKIADFVILDKNPLEVEKSQIRNIRVLETIKEGTSVFRI